MDIIEIPTNDQTMAIPGKVSSLEELIQVLHKIFKSERINVEQVKELLFNYKSKESEWKKYAKFDRYKYTRNLVDAGNGAFNLIILCWGEGHASPIHDHADAHCFMKMLKGELQEIKYNWPEGENDMEECGRTRIGVDEVCYINDSIGLHRVENTSNSDTAVSLHLYSPPFDSCHIFNHQTGQKTRVPVTFWSKYGEGRDREVQDSRPPEDV